MRRNISKRRGLYHNAISVSDMPKQPLTEKPSTRNIRVSSVTYDVLEHERWEFESENEVLARLLSEVRSLRRVARNNGSKPRNSKPSTSRTAQRKKSATKRTTARKKAATKQAKRTATKQQPAKSGATRGANVNAANASEALLAVLKAGGGYLDRKAVFSAVEKRLKNVIGSGDTKADKSGNPRWHSVVNNAYQKLIKAKHLKPASDTPRGVWALIDAKLPTS